MTIIQKTAAAHPTVVALGRRKPDEPVRLTVERVRQIAVEAGADDAGVVALDHPDLAEEVRYATRALPGARSFVSIVLSTHRDNIRSPARSVANVEFHRAGRAVDEVLHRVAVELSRLGHRSIHPAMAFPMEMDEFPGRTWVVSHKKVAVAAQLGRMGIHRSVIHPRLGSFVLLGTVITQAAVEGTMPGLDFDPCLSCKLCVAACPVGALEPDGTFHFSACYDHNYREFMTGFGDLTEAVAESRDRHALRDRVSESESASMWQSLAYGPNYKAAYCIAVCPAGEDVIGPWLTHKKQHVDEVLRPLTERTEQVYVVRGSDAEAHVKKRFPHKAVRLVESSLRATSARAFFRALPLVFQRGPARGWSGTFHFELAAEGGVVTATVRITDGTLHVDEALVGEPDVHVRATEATWLGVVTKRRNPALAVLLGRLRVRGDRALLDKFASCFPR